MKFKSYTADEANRFVGATAILGEVVAQCSRLHYTANNKDEKDAILEFMNKYVRKRAYLNIDNKEEVEQVYSEVKPLIREGITVEYIMQNTLYAYRQRV
jgi:hypothetical protein